MKTKDKTKAQQQQAKAQTHANTHSLIHSTDSHSADIYIFYVRMLCAQRERAKRRAREQVRASETDEMNYQ